MPIVSKEIPQTYENITRPINTSVVRDLITMYNLPNNTNVRYIGDGSSIAQAGSTLAAPNEDAIFPFKGKIVIETTENYLESTLSNVDNKHRYTNDIFQDREVGVTINPTYTRVEAEISFSYKTHNRGEALRWRDALRNKTKLGLSVIPHELIYHYALPKSYLEILKAIHRNMEALDGYNKTFTEWIDQHFTRGLGLAYNLSGGESLLTISEKQIQVFGMFSHIGQPDQPTKDKEGNLWSLDFTYTFEYDKLTNLVLKYPVMVYNQLLESKYIPTEVPYDSYQQPVDDNRRSGVLSYFSVLNYKPESRYIGIRLPSFDDWLPVSTPKGYLPLVTALFSIDTVNPNILLNLRDLGEYNLNDDILDYILLNRNYVSVLNRIAIYIQIFRGKIPLSKEDFYIDGNLNVCTYIPLDFKDIHHIVIYSLTDLKKLHDSGTKELLQIPPLTKAVVNLVELLSKPKLLTEVVSFIPLEVNQNEAVVTAPSTVPTTTQDTTNINTADNVNIGDSVVTNNNLDNTVLSNLVETDISLASDKLKVIGNKLVTTSSFNEVIDTLKTDINLTTIGQGRGMYTVLSTGIIVKDKRMM